MTTQLAFRCDLLTIQTMSRDIQNRLKKLGVVKGTRHLKSTPKPRLPQLPESSEQQGAFASISSHENDGDVSPISLLIPSGVVQSTAEGECFVVDKVYPLSYLYGDDLVGDVLRFELDEAARFTSDGRFQTLSPRDCLFIDTETTGLAGAGTIAFMVGVAFFEENALVVRQYFLRDHGDEPAMLLLLDELLQQKKAVASFNGRSFDLPLLDRRFLMNRMPNDLLERPHLDLLMPARRLWRSRLGSCALGALEKNLLGVKRTHEDVPGWLIPGLYHDYLRRGDGREMVRVFYHNQLDMVSMVTLMSRVLRQFSQPDLTDHPLDLLSLGRWSLQLGDVAKAEQQLRIAIKGDLSLEMYHKGLYELAGLLKRNGRRAEAVPLWQQIASTTFDDVDAHIELAKHFEWQEQDIAKAILWTEQALNLVGRHPIQSGELAHRLNRLRRKYDQ